MKASNLFTVPRNAQEAAEALVELQVQLADLKKAETFYKDVLKDAGPATYDTPEHRVTVTTPSSSTKEVVNWEAIALKLEPSRQLVTAHTTEKVTNTASSVRVFGRKTNAE